MTDESLPLFRKKDSKVTEISKEVKEKVIKQMAEAILAIVKEEGGKDRHGHQQDRG